MENIKTYFHEGNQILTGKEDKLKLALANFLASGYGLRKQQDRGNSYLTLYMHTYQYQLKTQI